MLGSSIPCSLLEGAGHADQVRRDQQAGSASNLGTVSSSTGSALELGHIKQLCHYWCHPPDLAWSATWSDPNSCLSIAEARRPCMT